MRFRHPDGQTVHLAYCTNVHPAEDLDGVLRQLDAYALPVRERLGVPRLGLGLWLAREVATTLRSDAAALARLRSELDARGLEVVTLNGFPYAGFGQEVVKLRVYSPDWSEPERLRYTVDLAWLLAALLPDDVARGSISTLPLAWREPWGAPAQAAARRQLDVLAGELATVAAETGRTIRVAIEPEPGCVVETGEQVTAFLAGLDAERIGLCLDACHLAVAFEDADGLVARLDALGLSVVKLQASAALHADDPSDPGTRAALASFVEPRYLHQTRERVGGELAGRDDLDAALAAGDGVAGLPAGAAWRVHFHVPLHADPEPPLRSTREELQDTLRTLFAGAAARTDTVEVETYTWHVLPERLRPQGDAGLVAGIAAELTWARDNLLALGLQEIG
ncbi:metabolite traffic protein EboE [Motilibacter aurantiacus]|uniref:metabolite traffic protein EboE n=1 Tax=Motilibacter aurantiacus TaxID=2714955 RepID=UPI00140E8412|nr:metabolite traffic protein EboE [Motilibacter aurantiacus]NHC45859.1 metabolite traffic protein EboE [Motilibacter aurantiacus]